MQLGMVGLGRMGANMVRRLMRGGHDAVAFDLNPERARELAAEGATPAASLDELIGTLRAPRTVWLMVPAGEPTEQMVTAVADRLSPGDVIIDGGNSNFKDDVRRAAMLAARQIDYVDVGTSGGLWGLDRGYSLMIGGAPAAVERLDPIFRTLAPGQDDTPPTPGRTGGGTAEKGYLYCGPAGAGHFVKMVHNGIEYGLMQAYAEGFDILRHAADAHLPADQRYDFNLADIAEVWRHGSVVGSWLLDLTASALAEDPGLTQFTGHVQDSGEGRWTIEAAIAEAVPVEVLASALFARFRSRQDHTFAEKVLSAMRFKFGGHVERAAGG
jgi:6-phosphogluconate dehydrogenase